MRSQQFRLESDLAEMKSLYSKLEARFAESQAEKQVISNPESSFPFISPEMEFLLFIC